MVPSTLLSWQFLVPVGVWSCSRAGTGSSSRLSWEESDWSQINPREEGSRKTAFPAQDFSTSHTVHCAFKRQMFQREKINQSVNFCFWCLWDPGCVELGHGPCPNQLLRRDFTLSVAAMDLTSC